MAIMSNRERRSADADSVGRPAEETVCGNVFEWALEQDVDGDTRRVLCYLAFHATDDAVSYLPYDSDYEDDLKLDYPVADDAIDELIDAGLVRVDWGSWTYTFPAYETWKAQH